MDLTSVKGGLNVPYTPEHWCSSIACVPSLYNEESYSLAVDHYELRVCIQVAHLHTDGWLAENEESL